jgi:hypothetical protein
VTQPGNPAASLKGYFPKSNAELYLIHAAVAGCAGLDRRGPGEILHRSAPSSRFDKAGVDQTTERACF